MAKNLSVTRGITLTKRTRIIKFVTTALIVVLTKDQRQKGKVKEITFIN